MLERGESARYNDSPARRWSALLCLPELSERLRTSLTDDDWASINAGGNHRLTTVTDVITSFVEERKQYFGIEEAVTGTQTSKTNDWRAETNLLDIAVEKPSGAAILLSYTIEDNGLTPFRLVTTEFGGTTLTRIDEEQRLLRWSARLPFQVAASADYDHVQVISCDPNISTLGLDVRVDDVITTANEAQEVPGILAELQHSVYVGERFAISLRRDDQDIDIVFFPSVDLRQ